MAKALRRQELAEPRGRACGGGEVQGEGAPGGTQQLGLHLGQICMGTCSHAGLSDGLTAVVSTVSAV